MRRKEKRILKQQHLASRFLLILIVVLLVVSPFLLFSARGATVTQLSPSDDSWVQAEFPNRNYSSDTTLIVKSDAKTRRTYLKFYLNSIPLEKSITSAKLYLHCVSANPTSNVQVNVNETGDGWSESTITWNNAPSVGAFVASTDVGGMNQSYFWDITSYAQTEYSGDKILSVVVKFLQDDPSQNNPNYEKKFASKENSDVSVRPYLEIVYATTSPTASFTYSPSDPIANETVTFNASSSDDPDGTIVSYDWDFRDGINGTGMITTHNYTSAGTYNVTLTVTDNDGLTNSTTVSVTVNGNKLIWFLFKDADGNPIAGVVVTIYSDNNTTDPNQTYTQIPSQYVDDRVAKVWQNPFYSDYLGMAGADICNAQPPGVQYSQTYVYLNFTFPDNSTVNWPFSLTGEGVSDGVNVTDPFGKIKPGAIVTSTTSPTGFALKLKEQTLTKSEPAVVQLVPPVNTPPVADDQSVTTAEDTPKGITLTASDPESDPLTYFIVDYPSHGSLSGSPPTVTYTPDPDYTGSDSFTFKAYDGQAYSNVATVSITVTPVNDPPVVGDIPDVTFPEDGSDSSIDLDDYVSDVDNTDAEITWTFTGNVNIIVSIDASNVVTFTAPANWSGQETVTFRATDLGGLWDEDATTVTITSVNDPPVASDLAISPPSPVTTDDLVGSYTYYDADGNPESGSEIRWYKDGVLQPAYNNTLTIPLSETAKGEAWYFTVRPKDGTAFGALQTSPSVTIQNSPPTTAPVVDVTPDFPVTTDDLVCTITTPSTDPDGDPITYIYEWYKNGELQPDLTTDTVPASYTTEGDVWKCVVTPYGSDPGPPGWDQVTIQNSPPVLDPIGDKTVDEGALLQFTVTASDPDIPAQTLTYSASNLPPGATFNPDTHVFTWTPTSGQAGVYPGVHFEVSDGYLTDSEDITITVTPQLTASISPTSASIYKGQSVIFTSTVSGGTPPYSYQWYLNGNPVLGATSSSWTFTPTSSGIYYVYLKVTEVNNNTAQSETARITVISVPVGGYSISFAKKTPTSHIAAYTTLIALFVAALSLTKRKRK